MKQNLQFKVAKVFGLFMLFNINLYAQMPPNGDCDKVVNFNNDSYNDLIRVSKSVQFSGNNTIAGWFKTSIASRTLVLLSREFYMSQIGIHIELNSDGKISATHNTSTLRTATLTSSSVVNDNLWHHYAMVKTTDSVSLYVDGKREDVRALTGSLNSAIQYLVDLGSPTTIRQSFKGSMDEFSMWRRALTETEIKDISTKQLVGNESNLLLNLTFNEAVTDPIIYDKSPNKNNANFTTFNAFSRTLVEGKVCTETVILPPNNSCGSVLKFDGVDDHIATTIPGNQFYDRDFTIESWIYLNEYSDSMASVIMSTRKQNEGILFFVAGEKSFLNRKGRLGLQIGGGPTYSSEHFGNKFLETGKWYHVAVVYDFVGKAHNIEQNQVRFYVNGELDATFSDASNIKSPTVGTIPSEELYIGIDKKGNTSATYFFNGMIDEPRIWLGMRSETEIKATMNTSLTKHEPNLLASFNFNEGPNSPFVMDLNELTVENNYSGTLKNFDTENSWMKPEGVSVPLNSTSESTIYACDSYKTITDTVLSKSGSYLLVIPNKSGCDSIIKLNLIIYNSLHKNFIYLSGTTLSSNRSADNLEWVNCDKPELGVLATTKVFTPKETGNYKVVQRNVNCVVETECKYIFIDPNSVEDYLLSKIKLSPNPTNEKVFVDLGANYQDVKVKIYTIAGKVISNANYQSIQEFSTNIDQEPGLYLLEIQIQENAPVYMKILKK